MEANTVFRCVQFTTFLNLTSFICLLAAVPAEISEQQSDLLTFTHPKRWLQLVGPTRVDPDVLTLKK